MPPSNKPSPPEADAVRPDRASLLAFISDVATEHAIREGLSGIVSEKVELRHGGIRAAIAMLSNMASPLVLIVDTSGEENPFVTLGNLLQILEPNVRLLVVGDENSIDFYRTVTRELGALEYLHKPLTRDIVARYLGPLLSQQGLMQDVTQGGRLVTITGVRGGVGASTIAVNLSWYLGVVSKRHTVLLDTDLYRGVCAMMLGVEPGSGLRTALEIPERVDELLVERATQQVAERLHILAGEEDLTDQLSLPLGGAVQLSSVLRSRYNFVVVNLPFISQPLQRDLMHLAHQRVLVVPPTLAGIRDTLRLLAIPHGPAQPRRAVVVLNRFGMSGGLEMRQIIEGLQMKPDIVIPDIKYAVEHAGNSGKLVAQKDGPFHNAMQTLAREVGLNTRGVAKQPIDRSWFWQRK